jgi:hypothetical protein
MQSDTWALAAPDERPWLFMLWATAWQQTPCGSMPSDSKLICARLGLSAKQFSKSSEVLLRGWWLADDGRLYHDTIANRVLDMLKDRNRGAYRKFRDFVITRDGYECAYCGAVSGVEMTLDHVVPQAKGGAHSAENLKLACKTCNSSKGAKDLLEWIAS